METDEHYENLDEKQSVAVVGRRLFPLIEDTVPAQAAKVRAMLDSSIDPIGPARRRYLFSQGVNLAFADELDRLAHTGNSDFVLEDKAWAHFRDDQTGAHIVFHPGHFTGAAGNMSWDIPTVGKTRHARALFTQERSRSADSLDRRLDGTPVLSNVHLLLLFDATQSPDTMFALCKTLRPGKWPKGVTAADIDYLIPLSHDLIEDNLPAFIPADEEPLGLEPLFSSVDEDSQEEDEEHVGKETSTK